MNFGWGVVFDKVPVIDLYVLYCRVLVQVIEGNGFEVAFLRLLFRVIEPVQVAFLVLGFRIVESVEIACPVAAIRLVEFVKVF